MKYCDDPTIFAWEVMDEPRFQGMNDDLESKTLRSWMDEMGSKSTNFAIAK